jgi:putative N6-adenine-specific DNA methylase
VREAALAQELPTSPVPVFGSDRSSVALSSAKSNVRTAGMERDIVLRTGEFEQLAPPAAGCLLVMNPPYGERIAHEDIQRLYKALGDTLKRQYAGSEAWILSANREAEKQIGLRPSRRIQVFNGPIECRFLKFELYRGSRRGGE